MAIKKQNKKNSKSKISSSNKLNSNHLNLDLKYIIFSIVIGALSYLAYYLKFPKIYSIIISLVLLFLLIKNFGTIKSINIIFYLILLQFIVMPLNLWILPLSWMYLTIVTAINVIIFIFMLLGIYNLKKWGVILTIIVFLFSLATVTLSIIAILANFNATLPVLLGFSLMIISIGLVITLISTLIKSRANFN